MMMGSKLFISAAQFSAGTSVAPFLYQTKTICGFTSLQNLSKKVLPSSTAPSYRRPLHSTPRTADDKNDSSRNSDVGEKSSFTIRRIEIDGARESDEATSSTNLGSTSTRSHHDGQSRDQDRHVSSRRSEHLAEDNSTTFRRLDLSGSANLEEDIDFGSYFDAFVEDQTFNHDSIEAPEVKQVKPPRSRESTITISEKLAFDRIFEDIMSRQKGQAYPGIGKSAELEDFPESAAQRGQPEILGSIVDEAVEAKRRQQDLSFEGHSFSQAQERMREAVDRYPAALRASAAKAIGLIGGRAALHEEIRSTADDLESLRQPERERVEGLLRAAPTDLDLWQVLEREVFPMIARLGFSEKPDSSSKSSKRRKGRKSKISTSPVEEAAESPSAEELELDLAIYGPLYPSHLLLSLRLLDREFAKPSPLVQNLLPRIKSLGLISHVLGASTALYNELIRIYWYRYDDLNSVARLLTEMEQAGLDFDTETLNIVRDINRLQAKIKTEDLDTAIKQFWSMPEFKTGGFKEWQAKIEAAMEERGLSLAQSLA